MENLLPRYSSSRVWSMGFNATLGSFIFGYNIGVMTNLRESLSYYFDWGSNSDLFFHLSFPTMHLGAMLGAVAAGRISDRVGRRRALMFHDLIIILGCGLVAIPLTPFFPIGRFICGYGVGGFAGIVPNYLKEVCPDEAYGRVASLVQLQVTIGIVVSYALALGLPTGDVGSSELKDFWIVLYVFQAFIALIQLLLFMFIFKNETPEWLWRMNYKESVLLALREVYPENEANAIYDWMDKPADDSKFSRQNTHKIGYSRLLCCRGGSNKMMRMGYLLNIFQQTVGINAILGYLTEIFNEVNDDTFISRVLTLVGGVVNMMATMLVFPLVARFGRKTLLLIGNMGVVFCMLGTAIFTAFFKEIGDIPAVVLILLYLIAFEIGIGSICWVYCGEILTSKAISICTGVNWFAAFVTVLVYPFMNEALGFSETLGAYGLVALISVVYIYFDLFETKGLNPDEINNRLRRPPNFENSYSF